MSQPNGAEAVARQDVSIAQLTAAADLILVELQRVIGEITNILRNGEGVGE